MVSNLEDAASAMRRCVHLCTIMAHQQHQIKNTYSMRCAMICHLFTRVLPMPRPPIISDTMSDHRDLHEADTMSQEAQKNSKNAERPLCIWAQPMRYETQADLLRLLNMVCRHYATAALSLNITRSFDAERILIMSAIATVADAVVRVTAVDIPSQFSLHLSGKALYVLFYFF